MSACHEGDAAICWVTGKRGDGSAASPKAESYAAHHL